LKLKNRRTAAMCSPLPLSGRHLFLHNVVESCAAGSVHGRGVLSGGIGGGKTFRSGSGAGVVTAAGGLGWSCSTSH
jgi:hypothetical protein